MVEFHDWVNHLLQKSGLGETLVPYLKVLLLLSTLLLLAWLAQVITKKFVVKAIHSVFQRTATKWDDILIENKTFRWLAHIVPATILRVFTPVVFADFPQVVPLFFKAIDAYIIIIFIMVLVSLLRGAEFFLSAMPAFKDKPIASYFQLVRIIIYIAAAIMVLSVLLGRSPLYFLSAFGAMTAIILLIFKDTILGLVASVQISANDMARVGDWVEVPKYNADGDVIAMNLNTVKIRNWDKTITTIPTYYFITDSFKNWRGMQESGGRRIKRSLYINLRSIKFVDNALGEKLDKFYFIKDYIAQRQHEIDVYNANHNFDTSQLVNGRRMTNIGVFRKYTETFLQNHKSIRQDMSLMVRQLPPTEFGLPLEIYCFTDTIKWVEYEGIQSDIFDHIIAAAPHFDLEIYQATAGSDIMQVGEQLRLGFPTVNN